MMKQFCCAAVASGIAMVAAAPAHATVYLVSPLTGGIVTAPGAFTLDPILTTTRAPGSYTDSFVFTLSNATALSASDLSSTAVGNTNLDFSPAVGGPASLAGVQLRRFNTALNTVGLGLLVGTNTGATDSGLTTGNSTFVANYATSGAPGPVGTEGKQLGSTLLSAGTYGILVNYTITGAPAAYSGNLQLAATPSVPEPATWAMMIMGFSTIGFALRRRERERLRIRFV